MTGYVRPGETPGEAAVREVREELGLEVEASREGRVVVVHTDWGDTLHGHPYLCAVDVEQVNLEREHVDYAWIEPREVYDYDHVQQLDEDLEALGLL